MSTRRGEQRAFVKELQLIGWHFLRVGKDSHVHLQHATGARYVLGGSPSDKCARRAALSDLERIAGMKLATAKARKRH